MTTADHLWYNIYRDIKNDRLAMEIIPETMWVQGLGNEALEVFLGKNGWKDRYFNAPNGANGCCWLKKQ